MPSLFSQISKVFRKAQEPQKQTTTQKIKPSSPVTLLTAQTLQLARNERIPYSWKMYMEDGRIQESLNTVARDIVKSGFDIELSGPRKAQRVVSQIKDYIGINENLYDWVRRTLIEGEQFFEIVVNSQREIVGLERLETLYTRVNVDDSFKIANPQSAYWYSPDLYSINPSRNAIIYPQWAVLHAKWLPDEKGVYGIPMFYASQTAYKRVHDGEDDIYVARRVRAGRTELHVIEDGTESDIEQYKEMNAAAIENPLAAQRIFFANKKSAIQQFGDNFSVGDVKDIMHNIETMLVSSPVPSGLIGYGQQYNRDTLSMQKEQYDIAIDFLTEQWCVNEYIQPLLHFGWLLVGVLPEQIEYRITWRYRVILSPDQLAKVGDAILRLRAAGVGEEIIAKLMARYFPGFTLGELTRGIRPVEINPNDVNKSATSNGTDRKPRLKSTNTQGANLEPK